MDVYLATYSSASISMLTYYEIKHGLLFRDAHRQLSNFQHLVQTTDVLPLSISIVDMAAEIYATLRRQGKTIGHVDLLIGCTALESGIALATNNVRHFSHIPGLEVVNWTVGDIS